jgi:hypothetical protein
MKVVSNLNTIDQYPFTLYHFDISRKALAVVVLQFQWRFTGAAKSLQRTRPGCSSKLSARPSGICERCFSNWTRGASTLLCAGCTPLPARNIPLKWIFADPLVVVTRPNHPLACRRRIEFAELLDEPWPCSHARTVWLVRHGAKCLPRVAISRWSLAIGSYCHSASPRMNAESSACV